MEDWKKLYKGPCRECGEKDNCYKGLCLPCRQPSDRRELVKFGVPCGSADALALIMSKCKSDADTERTLKLVHPRLMQNIVVVGRVLKVRNKKYHWMRRGDWVKA